MIEPRAARAVVAALGLGLGLLGCTTVDDPAVREIGAAVPFLIDSDLRTQAVTTDPADWTIQVAEWTITREDFEIDGVVTDLTFGEECAFTDTALVSARGKGACASGVVIGSGPTTRPVTVELTLTLRVRRAEPLLLPAASDYDGDGVANAGDNCVLIDNPDQTSSPGADFGDACAVRDSFSGASFLDNDRDGVADLFDNCPHVANPLQADTQGVGGDGIPDGIGDACTEQVAIVRVSGSALIELSLGPENLIQPQYRTTFLTVDFQSSDALSCNWVAGTCDLDPSAIDFCAQTTAIGACL